MNVLIPLGGIGQRFAEQGYVETKPLIRVFGKPILFWLIDSLRFKENDQLYIICHPQLKSFYLDEQLEHEYPNVKVHYLSCPTQGAAQTLLEGTKIIAEDRHNLPTICVDGDSFFSVDILNIYRQSADKTGIFYFKDRQESPIYSYVVCDESGIITEMKEKEKISNNACCGVYCFESVQILAKYASEVILTNSRALGEFYTSTIYQLMLAANIRVRGFEIDHENFHCLGTPLQMMVFCNNVPRQFAVEGSLPINIETRRFCFDLDNTLVGPPLKAGDYTTCQPIQRNIDFLRYLKRMGHYIIIHTARRMRTHHGNVGKVVADIGGITVDTLEKFNIPYDELHFGKPYAHYYIDDKSVSAYTSLEKTLGYYSTKVQEREFNSIASSSLETIVKKSKDRKLLGEIYWYKSLPNEIKDLFPIFLRSGAESNLPYWYEVEKISGICVSQLWTSANMKPELISHILGSLNRIHSAQDSSDQLPYPELLYSNYARKIKLRYDSYDYSIYPGAAEVYEELLEYFESYERLGGGDSVIIHGDPVFTNILINSFGKLKFIDMRGMQEDVTTKIGDRWYDYGKVYQSLIGYDELLLGKQIDENFRRLCIEQFERFIISNFGEDKVLHIQMIAKSLLFSLIPLHSNDKCFKYLELAKTLASAKEYSQPKRKEDGKMNKSVNIRIETN